MGGLGGIAGILTAMSAMRQARGAAQKTDLESIDIVLDNLREGYDRLVVENRELRGTVQLLQDELTLWKAKYERLYGWALRYGLDPATLRE